MHRAKTGGTLLRRAVTGAAIVVVAVAAVLASVLWSQERGGPPHRDVTLPGGVPATFYLPGTEDGAPAPVVVMGHGYSGDRTTMSSLARSLAEAGYAVVAIDFRGHGANDNGTSAPGDRADDLAAAVDWAEDAPEVDGARIGVLGHSMGARAALDLAARDPRVTATIVLGSGHRPPVSSGRPRNVLFLVAEGDPRSIHDASSGFARDLAGVAVADGQTARASDGTAVRMRVVRGTDHIRILWTDQAVAETVAWLDGVFGLGRAETAQLVDPRLVSAAAYLLCCLALLGALGWFAGGLAPPSPSDVPGGWRGPAAVALSLVAAAPAPTLISPPPFLSPGFGEVVVHLTSAGSLLTLLVVFGSRPGTRLSEKWTGAPPALWPSVAHTSVIAGAAIALALVLFAPLGSVFHRLVPTPDRLLVGVQTGALLLPFFVPFQTILRHDRPAGALANSLAGHSLVLAALASGVLAGTLPGIVALALPLLLGVFVLVEIFGTPAYARGRSGLFVGFVETLCVAGIVAVTMPLT